MEPRRGAPSRAQADQPLKGVLWQAGKAQHSKGFQRHFLFKGTPENIFYLSKEPSYKANFYCTIPPYSSQYLTFIPLPILINSLFLKKPVYRNKNYSETFFKRLEKIEPEYNTQKHKRTGNVISIT